MFKIGLSAATLCLALATIGMASGTAVAGPYESFCKGGSPTPKHVCDTIKSHEKAKPQRIQAPKANAINAARRAQ